MCLNRDTPGRRRLWRPLLLLLLVVGALLTQQTAAQAQPGDPAAVPPSLRQYVIDSAEWQRSPWMTAEQCRDRGGDFSTYVAYMIQDLPELLAHFQPTFAGTDPQSAARKELLVGKFRESAATVSVPPGYCVAQMKRWATPNPSFKPFGFEWGNLTWWDDQTHGVRPYGCMAPNVDVIATVGPCRGFYITCVGIITQQDQSRCEAWNAFSDEYVRRMNEAIFTAYNRYPTAADCVDCVTTEIKSPGEIAQDFLNWVAKEGMEQVVAFVVSGVTKLWATFTSIAVEHSKPNLGGVAFASVYNLVAGIALAVAFLGWLLTLATSWKQGRLQFSLFGGLKAVIGVTLAAVGAILMLQLADEATLSLLTAAGDVSQADFTGSLVKVNPLVAILAGIVTAVCLIFAIIFLVLHGALVLMWTLFGSIAAAGQVHPASADWLPKWAARLTALAWAKFVMVAVMLLAQRYLLPLDPGEDAALQVIEVIHGLVLAALVVLCPYLLLELVEFVSDRPGGVPSSAGPAARMAGHGTSRAAGALSGAAGAAVSTMMAAGASIARTGGTSSTTGSSTGGGDRERPATPKTEPGTNSRTSAATTPPSDGTPDAPRSHPPASSDGSAGNEPRDEPNAAPAANRGRVVARAPRPARPGSQPTRLPPE